MTDVKFIVEGIDHALSPEDALALAKELKVLAHAAQVMDAPPPPEEFKLINGMVARSTVAEILAWEYPRVTDLEWHVNQLWTAMTYSPWLCKTYCLECETLAHRCPCPYTPIRERQQRLGIKPEEFCGHCYEFRRKLSLRGDYGLVERELRLFLRESAAA